MIMSLTKTRAEWQRFTLRLLVSLVAILVVVNIALNYAIVRQRGLWNVDVLLLVDRSETVIHDDTLVKIEVSIADSVIRYILDHSPGGANNRVGMIIFGTSPTTTQVISLTSDISSMMSLSGVARNDGAEKANYGEAFQLAREQLARHRPSFLRVLLEGLRQPVVILITAGKPGEGIDTMAELRKSVGELKEVTYGASLGTGIIQEWISSGLVKNAYSLEVEKEALLIPEAVLKPFSSSRLSKVQILAWLFANLLLIVLLSIWRLGSRVRWFRAGKPSPDKEFQNAISSRNYKKARGLFDAQYRKDGQEHRQYAGWLYLAEDYVCNKELYKEALPAGSEERQGVKEAKALFRYGNLTKEHLNKAKGYESKLGIEEEFKHFCEEYLAVLDCIRWDKFPSKLEEEVKEPFLFHFEDAISMEPGPNSVLEIAVVTDDPVEQENLFQEANQRLMRKKIAMRKEEKKGEEQVEHLATLWLSTERLKGLIAHSRLGKGQLIDETYLRAMGRPLLKEGDPLNYTVSHFADCYAPRDKHADQQEEEKRFYDALSHLLRYTSEEARHAKRKLDYVLCYRYSELLWAVASKDAEIASLALRSIFEALDPSDRRKNPDYNDLYGLCYFLMSLDWERALSGAGTIYFFDDAKKLVRNSARYKDLFDLLIQLQGKRPGDPLVSSIIRQIEHANIPRFEKRIVRLLLEELEKPG